MQEVGWDEEHEEDYRYNSSVFYREVAYLIELRREALMSCLFNDIVEHEYQRGQEGNDGDNAEDNALCHDKTHILAEREAHEAQREEAENGCQRAAHKGEEGRIDCRSHGVLLRVMALLLLLESVHKEDGVVDRNAKLEDSGDTLRYERNLAEDYIRAHVVYDRGTECGKKHEREHPRSHCERQCYKREGDGDYDIERSLAVCQVFCINGYRRKTAQEHILVHYLAYGSDSVHSHLRRARVLILNHYQRRAAVLRIEDVGQNLGKNLFRYRHIRDVSGADNIADALDLADLIFELLDILGLGVFYYNK